MTKISLYDLMLEKNKTVLSTKATYNGLDKYEYYDDMVLFLNKNLKLNKCAREYVYVFAFNNNLNPLGVYNVSSGSNVGSLICIREIFSFLLMIGAEQFVVFHNHPSGILDPSFEDYSSTQKIISASCLIGIKFIDHIIISKNKWNIINKDMNSTIVPKVSMNGIN